MSLTEAMPSLAVTFIGNVNTKFGAVPEKVRVAASKVRKDGSAPPLPCVAV